MKFKKHSPEAVAELLMYLADHEDFKSLKGLKTFSSSEVSSLFREMAKNLQEYALNQPLMAKDDLDQKEISGNLSRVVSHLTPQEENLLFKSFRIS